VLRQRLLNGVAIAANLIGSRLPWLIGVVVALSLGLLLVVFRSVVIAVKAAVMNLLSVCAAYGVLTAVTQWGWLGHVFGFGAKMPVTTWVPVFLFVILFGLSMDYEVFLLAGPAAAGARTDALSVDEAPGRDARARPGRAPLRVRTGRCRVPVWCEAAAGLVTKEERHGGRA
jgi:uncharacterized membrane protein YdfJ with MMPL/SSD domain